jgi:hypothetical protein
MIWELVPGSTISVASGSPVVTVHTREVLLDCGDMNRFCLEEYDYGLLCVIVLPCSWARTRMSSGSTTQDNLSKDVI